MGPAFVPAITPSEPHEPEAMSLKRRDNLAAAITAVFTARQPNAGKRHKYVNYLRAGTYYRLAGKPDLALGCFDHAGRYTSNQLEDAEVLREVAAVYRDNGDTVKALRALHRALPLTPDDTLAEAQIILGIGQIHLANGERERARRILRESHQPLHGRGDAAELKSLIWRMKAEPPHGRIGLAVRAVRVAHQTKSSVRALEAVALLVGGNLLYDLLNPRKRK